MPYHPSDVAAAKSHIQAAVPHVVFFETFKGMGVRAHRGDKSCIVFQPEIEGFQTEIVADIEEVIRILAPQDNRRDLSP